MIVEEKTAESFPVAETRVDDPNISIRIPDSSLPRLVIIGGGFAGIRLVKKLENAGLQIVMFDRHNYHTFQPLLYQVATAGLEPDSVAGPLRKLFGERKNFYFRYATVERINPDQNTISTSIGDLKYDYLVIANGTKTNYFGNEGVFKNAFPLKQIPQALDLRSQILQNLEKAVLINQPEKAQSLLNFVIVGGGPTGVEVAGALGELKLHVLPKDYAELDFSRMKIFLIEGMDRLLPSMSKRAGDKSLKYLKRFEVEVKLNTIVTAYDGDTVTLSDGSEIPCETLVWAAGVMGNVIGGIPSTSVERNRILVNQYNQVKGYERVFAIGDIACMKTEDYPNGHPMLAPVAIQQGQQLGKNLRNMLKGKDLKPFKYFDKGSMATIGRNKAVVDLPGGRNFGGLVAWFIWMFIHLVYIIGFRNKLVVMSNWLWNYITYDRGTRLIIRKFDRNNNQSKKME